MAAPYSATLSTETAATRSEDAAIARNRKLLRAWLGLVLLAVFALVIVGGATRLTESGLSITEWKPIHGIIPPLTEAEWEEELELYRQIPQYQEINRGMSLDEFKVIFWWEWAHRVLARGVGILFGIPLIVFWATGRIEQRLKLPLLGLLALGGFQGFVGWWMVSSGLVDRVDVSQYRLATHLTIAAFIFAAITWVSRGLAPHTGDRWPRSSSARGAGWLVALVLLQIYLGAFVAGLNAGMTFNTWPLMDGQIVPSGLFAGSPAWLNLFENVMTVQFNHRVMAYVILLVAAVHMARCLLGDVSTTHARRSVVLFALIVLQAIIGIVTLVLVVPLSWALLHQAMAFVVLAFAVAHWRGFYGQYPVEAHA